MAIANPALSPEKFQQSIDESQPGWAAPGGPSSVAPSATGPAAPAGTAALVPSAVGPDPVLGPDAVLRPPVGAVTGKVMTFAGTFSATFVLFVLLLAAGWWGWSQTTQVPGVTDPVTGQTTYSIDAPGWLLVVGLLAFGVAILTIFMPRLARFTGPVYALLEGAILGSISAMYNARFDGIVLQAVLATVAVFAVMLFLYATRIVRVTKRFTMIIVGAMAGIFLLYLGSAVASLFGADVTFWNEPTPLGIGISLLIVGVASFRLMLDFAFVESAVEARAPRYMEWYAGFGLMIGLVWLYLEILRLLSLLRQR